MTCPKILGFLQLSQSSKIRAVKLNVANAREFPSCLLLGRICLMSSLTTWSPAYQKDNLPEAQCAFCSGNSTAGMVFAVCQGLEKCIEQKLDLYTVPSDLTKAFYTVNREVLFATCQIVVPKNIFESDPPLL